MSIATEIQRLQQAKADIKTAIENKGVTVGDGTIDTFASKISEITGGGGSAEGCVTVTFMNGANVLLTRPVYIGDDCPDPITQGRIETPTKESTPQYNYTYSGWTSVDGGTADGSILKNITEDKVIYATFTETVRTYTVTFYDEDGTTVLHTQQVAYGTMPSYTPNKNNYTFKGWTPSLEAVTGNASYTANWEVALTLNDYSWQQLDEMTLEEAQEKFSLGDKKTFKVYYNATSFYNMSFYLAGFNVDTLASGGKAKMTFLGGDIGTANWSSGYKYSQVCNSIPKIDFSLQPDTSWENAIKSVVKTVVNGDGTTDTLNLKLWVPSLTEYGYTHESASEEGNAYPKSLAELEPGVALYSTRGTRSTPIGDQSKLFVVEKGVPTIKNKGIYTFGAGFCI